jgi:hypothetical protein
MLSAFRIYILERDEEIDVDTNFENIKSNITMLFSSKSIFCITVFAVKCKDSKREAWIKRNVNLEFLQRFSYVLKPQATPPTSRHDSSRLNETIWFTEIKIK